MEQIINLHKQKKKAEAISVRDLMLNESYEGDMPPEGSCCFYGFFDFIYIVGDFLLKEVNL